jgi:hypothetical protein
MSHVVTMKVKFTDLISLEAAAKHLGLEMVKGQTTYKWFGTHVGDYPMPKGFTKEDLGSCDHVLRVKGAGSNTYEVGVVKNKDGTAGYQLLMDFWAGGYGLCAKIGKQGELLEQEYKVRVAMRDRMRQGFKVTREETADGTVRIVCKQ